MIIEFDTAEMEEDEDSEKRNGIFGLSKQIKAATTNKKPKFELPRSDENHIEDSSVVSENYSVMT